jgi:hypothetical protein
MHCATYLEQALNYAQRRHIIAVAARKLRYAIRRRPFDAIACIGTSGLLIAPSVADRLKVNLVVVRKEKDAGWQNHSDYHVEGPVLVNRFVFLDDQVSSGRTLTRVLKKVRVTYGACAQFYGAYCYNSLYGKLHRPTVVRTWLNSLRSVDIAKDGYISINEYDVEWPESQAPSGHVEPIDSRAPSVVQSGEGADRIPAAIVDPLTGIAERLMPEYRFEMVDCWGPPLE